MIKMIELTQIEIEIGYGDDCEFVEITRGEVLELITRLREAEKDAARYRWLIDNSVFGMKQNGVSWSLQFDGPAPEHSGKIGECIDQAMKEKGDE